MRDKRSYPKQGYTPAIPFSQGIFPILFPKELSGSNCEAGISEEIGSIIFVLLQVIKKSIMINKTNRFTFFFKIK